MKVLNFISSSNYSSLTTTTPIRIATTEGLIKIATTDGLSFKANFIII